MARSEERAAARKQALVVLGMHRSGTSAVARVLSLLGADLPADLVPPAPDNELGFWEPSEIVATHDRLLTSIGSAWDDVSPIPRDWFGSAAEHEFREHLLKALEQAFGGSSMFVVKDPRICRLLPLWLPLLKEFGAEPKLVITVRNPLEVAASLKARNDFPCAKSLLLWLGHVVEAEHQTRGYRRSFLTYEELLDDWRLAVRKTADELRILWPDESRKAAEIDLFLSDRLRHTAFDLAELEARPGMARWVVDCYRAIVDGEPGADPAASVFDAVRREMATADLAYGPLLAHERGVIEGLHRQAERAAEEASKQIRAAAARIEELERQIVENEARAETRRTELEQRIAELEAALEEIFRSRSWRATRPLRSVGALVRKVGFRRQD